jgi:hypothetical protein
MPTRRDRCCSRRGRSRCGAAAPPRHLRLYRHQPELGLRALRQVLATDCNRSPRPELSYVMRWDGLVVSYTISDDAERTTTVSTAQLGHPASAHLAPPPPRPQHPTAAAH